MRLRKKKVILVYLMILLMGILTTCGNNKPNSNSGISEKNLHEGETFSGLASYYATRFDGRKTASGEIFDSDKMTAAHKTLPFGTLVRVSDPESGISVVVRINDRGPFSKKRVIDVSEAAAIQLNMIRKGLLHVEVTVLE